MLKNVVLISFGFFCLLGSLNAQTIMEAEICERIENREPVNAKQTFQKNEVAYCWIKVADATVGSKLKVNWYWNGTLQHEQDLSLTFTSMRTYCNKTLHSEGEWRVDITNDAGTILKSLKVTVTS